MTTSITIIVPAFNAERTIVECLDSVGRQTYRDFDLIVIDDGSTDATGEIIERYCQTVSTLQIRLIRSPNQGVSAARNRGIGHATGDFLLFLDADDLLTDDALELLVSGQRRSGAKMVIGGFDRFDDATLVRTSGGTFQTDTMLSSAAITAQCCRYLDQPNRNSLFSFSWGRLISRDLFIDHGIGFDVTMRTFEDVKFNFELIYHVDIIYYVARPVYRYRVSRTILSQSTEAISHPDGLLGFAKALETALTVLEERCGGREWAARWVGRAFVTYTIIHLIRLCRQLRVDTIGPTLAACRRLVGHARLQEYLVGYRGSTGDSVVLPFLLRHRAVHAIVAVCMIKAWMRYGLLRRTVTGPPRPARHRVADGRQSTASCI